MTLARRHPMNDIEKTTRYIDIVMAQGPGPESQFIEVEDPNGWSVSVGKWIPRNDGTWALRITPEAVNLGLYEMPRQPGWYLDKNGDVIRVDGSRYTRPGQHSYKDFHYREFAPFTRLVPEVVPHD